MSRLERPTQKSSNPAKRFLEWKSNDKCFSYYDKDKQENIQVQLPLKVLFMEHYHTVKGWNDASESAIFSNEVFLIGQEEMNVRSFKGGEIASGLYKDIKSKVKDCGGKYHRSIYVMLEDGTLANIQLKGSAVSSYSDFYNDHGNKLDYNWMVIDKALDGKKGSIKYSYPNFTIGDKISSETDKEANEVAAELQEYMKAYTEKAEDNAFSDRKNSEVDKYEEKSDQEVKDALDL